MKKLQNKNIFNQKIIDILFLIMSFSLAFNNIPKFIQMNFIGGVLGNKLIFYPLIFGFIYTVYLQSKNKIKFQYLDKALKFIFIYSSIIILSLIFGLYNYPYYDLVINGPLNQIEKLPKVLNILQQLGINIDEKLIVALWMIVRTIKNLLLEIVYTFCGAYMIYCWYYDNWKYGFKIFVKGIIAALLVMFSYNLIEVLYLAGNYTAESILKEITPYFHTIKTSFDWWPPLLWKGQLRSYFSEPSNYGTYFAVVMPMLWYLLSSYSKTKKFLVAVAIIFFTFCLFLTQARTAVVLFIGEIVILIIVNLYLKNINLLRNTFVIMLVSSIGFFASNFFINSFVNFNNVQQISQNMDNKKLENKIKNEVNKTNEQSNIKNIKKQESNMLYKIKNEVNIYLEKNVLSLLSSNKRSNGARYSTIIADFKIGLDNPILGVGSSLRNAYVPEYLPEMSQNNNEVNLWIRLQKEKGILKSGFPNLCEYTNRFAETGILGLGIFLLPATVLLKRLLTKIKNYNINADSNTVYVYFTISFIGIMASAIGSTINATYFYWILLGLGYAMCFGKENDVETNGDTCSRQEH